MVKKLRNLLGVRKIGHAGTLDPLASGLLLIGTGSKTKALTALQGVDKWYKGDILLGKTTLSYDLETPLLDGNQGALAQCNKTMIAAAAASFLGNTMQQPPAYSAIKVKGVAAYRKARQGKATNLAPRPITLHRFTITKLALPIVSFEVCCSKGTYIRSLAHDFGIRLGCGGCLKSLVRTRVGHHRLEDAYSLETLFEKVKLKEKQSTAF